MKTALHTGIIALLLFTGISASAQQKMQSRTPEEKAVMITTKMKANLKLSDDQYAKVKAVNLDFATKSDEIRKSENKKDIVNKMRNLDSQRMRFFKTILTPEQYTRYETQKNEAKERMRKNIERKIQHS